MSVFAELYVSDAASAIRYDDDSSSFPDKAQFTSFTPLELATFWSALTGRGWEELLNSFPNLLEVDGGVRLIHGLPAQFLTDLSTANPDQIRAATKEWAASEEMACDPEDVAPIVAALVDLARKAISSGRGVYLWNCV